MSHLDHANESSLEGDAVPSTMRVDGATIEAHLNTLARFGAHGKTGVWRLVYSPEWVAAQAQVAEWFAAAGLDVRRDAVGNVWGRLEGSEPGPVIVTGSHIDSERPGGRFDGALGIVGGLLALSTLREQYGTPRQTLEVVSLCEEEASRFSAANCWGSRAITGRIGPAEPESIRDEDDETIASAMREVGLDPHLIAEARRDDLAAFVELHIEQGPVLEESGAPIAIVHTITGYRQYVVELSGQANHAGTHPMDLRRDPMGAAAEIIAGVIGMARERGRPAVTTVGRLWVEPNSRAIVPSRVTFTIDVRHPAQDELRALCSRYDAHIADVAHRHGVSANVRIDSDRAPSASNPDLVRRLLTASEAIGVTSPTMHSGAVHDAQQFAHVCPTAMIFVQSRGGVSHSPEEFSKLDHIEIGVSVLATMLHDIAY